MEQRLVRATELGILVDVEDEWLLSTFTWATDKRFGHVYTAFDTPPYHVFIHHYIVGLPLDADYVVDHIDRNPLNNRRNNLRYITISGNILNSRIQDNPYRNIEQRRNGLFRVRLKRDGQYYDGPELYTTIEEAQRVRDAIVERWKEQE